MSCRHCGIEVRPCVLPRHEHFCFNHLFPLKPREFDPCLECGKICRGYEKKKYCSRSCSATASNRKRSEAGWAHSAETKHILQQKRLTQKNLSHVPKRSKLYVCGDCNRLHGRNGKYCKDCYALHIGGERKGSGKSKSGYFRGIYCGSTYELVWVAYRLDNNLPVSRFDGYILYGDNKRYYPDFVEGKTIHEMKGWVTETSEPILKEKELGAAKIGYEVKLYFKKDLEKEFNWVKNNYKFSKLEELYDTKIR